MAYLEGERLGFFHTYKSSKLIAHEVIFMVFFSCCLFGASCFKPYYKQVEFSSDFSRCWAYLIDASNKGGLAVYNCPLISLNDWHSWADNGNPVSVASVSSYDFYSAVYSLITMIPLYIVISTFEVGGQIRSVLMSPPVCPWKLHSIVRTMEIIFRRNRVADVRLISQPIILNHGSYAVF